MSDDMRKMMKLFESHQEGDHSELVSQIMGVLTPEIQKAVMIVVQNFEQSMPAEDDEPDDVYADGLESMLTQGIDLNSELVGTVLDLRFGWKTP